MVYYSGTSTFILERELVSNCLAFSYDTGVISGIKVMPDWLMTFGHYNGVDYELSTSMEALVVGILSAGTFVGALLAVSGTPNPPLNF